MVKIINNNCNNKFNNNKNIKNHLMVNIIQYLQLMTSFNNKYLLKRRKEIKLVKIHLKRINKILKCNKS